MIGVANPSLACLPLVIRVVGGHKFGVCRVCGLDWLLDEYLPISLGWEACLL